MKTETRVGIFILSAIGIFLYLSINIRAFRLDKDQFYMYKAYFDDTGGLTVKAPVKIAGVDVGWVESIELLSGGKAEVILRVRRNNKLSKNAYAMIHQDGLIGNKTLEVDPGDPSTGFLMPGSTLSMPGKTPASVGELLDQFRDIATAIHDVASSFKNVFASRQGEENMRATLDSVTKATDRMADFSETLQRSLNKNEENIDQIMNDFRATMETLRKETPGLTNSFRTNADKVGSAFVSVEDTAVQARDTFKEAGLVAEKINSGKGVIGKLVNEDETYGDLKKTVRGFKDYVGKTTSLLLNVDMHAETTWRDNNSKGYFDLTLRPNTDCFYMVQLVADERGSITRDVTYTRRMDEKGNVLRASELDIPLERKVEFADVVETTVRRKNDILFGLQFGKRFDRLAFRIGVFESSFGVGCDYYVPLQTDKLHWITTLEAFDFKGIKRINDSRPHLKWLNKLYFLRSLYTAFGVDDVCSKYTASAFFGGGLRFGDDDLKYFLSYLPVGKSGGR